MNEDWDAAIAFVLAREGGYTIDPKDPGGETNFGISKKQYPSLDIKSLTVDDAKKIYFTDYWQVCQCDQLPSTFAIAVFDTAVNQGVTKAQRMLQIALDVDVDGVIGQKTIIAAFKANWTYVIKFLALRLSDYAHIMAANQTLLIYSVNWSFRVLYLMDLVSSKNISAINKSPVS